MENEDVIRDQMEDTRTSLTEKLETLEKKVVSTVDSATTNVAETVESVKETVQETVSTVKDTVQDTICAVKDSVKEGVGAVKDVFDVSRHVERHPWLMIGGSVALAMCSDVCLRPARSPPRSTRSKGRRTVKPGNTRERFLRRHSGALNGAR